MGMIFCPFLNKLFLLGAHQSFLSSFTLLGCIEHATNFEIILKLEEAVLVFLSKYASKPV